MRFPKKTVLIGLFFPLALVLAQAQSTDPRGVLVYAEDETALSVTDGAGNILEVYLGMDIPAGSSIQTYATTAELKLEPNGSIIKLARDTLMSVDTLQKGTAGSNNVSVKGGKIRAVIARLTGREDNYTFYSRNTICGIRGTDFVLSADDVLAVADGAVDFTKTATSETLRVTTGNMVSGAADIFALTALTAGDMDSLFGNLQFTGLNPADVPGHDLPVVEEQPEEQPEEEKSAEPAAVPAETAAQPDETPTGTEEPGDDPLMKILGGVLAMEVGSFSVDGVTYSKLLFQPTFRVGRLEASLYLPFIYDQNLFDPADWYKPEGNNEWSFGTDQNSALDIVNDAFGDLFLKIRYLKWGKQRDPFYFAFGNYTGIDLGHGILINDYNNNSEFPAVRKVGLNLGAYGDRMDFEMVTEDLSAPLEQVAGARLAFPLIGPLSLGFSAATDLAPAQNLDPALYQSYIDKDPILLNFALDLDFPLFDRSAFTMLFYTDGAAMIPIIQGQPQLDYFLGGENIVRNYGASAGVLGNIFILDYKLEYQYADGVFHHGIYNSTYDKMRGERIREILDYMDSPVSYDPRQGIYGQAGFTLAEILYFSTGYNWLWSTDGPDLENDYLQMTLSLKPDVIPVVGIYGSIGYSRTGFAAAVDSGHLSFIDDKTTFSGELVYPVSEYLDIAMVLASALSRDTSGEIIYDAGGKAEATYSVTLDVRLHY